MTAEVHSLLAPSSADRWVNCPGSVEMSQKYPDLGGDEDAVDGRTCHTLAAGCLTGARCDDGETPPAITPEILDAARQYVAVIRSIHGGKASKIWVEERIDIPTVHRDCYGTPDAWFIDGRDIHIFDLKYGWGLVDAYRNWQLILYASGIISKFPAAQQPHDLIHCHIVQPRPYHPDGSHRTWTCKVGELDSYVAMARRAAFCAQSGGGQCASGKWCKHCSALLNCRSATLAWPSMFEVSGVVSGTDHTPQQLAMELSLLTRAKSLISHRLDVAEAAALGMATNGTEIPGWQIGRTAGKKVWSVPPAEVRAMAGLCGVSVDKPTDLITPTQAIKAGLPVDVVAQYSKTTAGSLRMEPVNLNKISEVFKNG